jgi:hypothetical protein
MKTDTWELYTTGRVNAFFSTGFGDGNPIPSQMNESIPEGGGLNPGVDSIPKLGPDGMALNQQGTFRSMRLRSGFVPNVLGLGLRRQLSETTKLKIFVAFWGTIETEAQRKTAVNFTAFQEGYANIEGPWGSVTAGRALSLFSRGAVQNDFMYAHGYALGFPGNIESNGPTNGMIGFGVLAAFFSPGISYATPPLAGLQLNVGVYDPTPLPGGWESTRYIRPEAELTYDVQAGSVKAHLFGNGAYQGLYSATGQSEKMYGAGYGGRIEVGPVHLGVAGHYGKGLGLQYALQPGSISIAPSLELRKFDGYSVLAQFVTASFDFNVGWGMSRTFQLQSDKDGNADPLVRDISLLKDQQAYSAVIVYHANESLHIAADYMHVAAKWFLGEKQNMDFFSTGVTATW